MVELPDPHWKINAEVDYEEIIPETLEEKEDREFEIYIDQQDDLNWIEEFR